MNLLATLGLAASLCVNGHPAPRSPIVHYGGYRNESINHPCRPGELCCPFGTVRDHRTPLCGGGLDSAENIQCQPAEESYVKDQEEREWCEAMCHGLVEPEDLQFHFRTKWGGKP